MVDMAHKLIMTSLIPFFGNNPDVALSVAMGVVLFYMIILFIVAPYRRKGDDRLQLLVLVAIFMYILAAHVFRELNEIDVLANQLISAVLITTTIALFIFFVVQGIQFLKKTFCAHRIGKGPSDPVYIERTDNAKAGTRRNYVEKRAEDAQIVGNRVDTNPLYGRIRSDLNAPSFANTSSMAMVSNDMDPVLVNDEKEDDVLQESLNKNKKFGTVHIVRPPNTFESPSTSAQSEQTRESLSKE